MPMGDARQTLAEDLSLTARIATAPAGDSQLQVKPIGPNIFVCRLKQRSAVSAPAVISEIKCEWPEAIGSSSGLVQPAESG